MIKRPTRLTGDIAIVGMSCLFPGADGPTQFWRNICAGVEAVGEPPADWGAERYLNATGTNHITSSRGGFLGDLYRFDPAELGVMPSSVDGSEPDQFLALRAARAALADSGYLRDGHDHTKTGIILGHSTYLHRGNAGVVQHGVVLDQTVDLLRQLLPEADEGLLGDLRAALAAKLPAFNPDMAPGLVPNVMTGRIANKLDLRGPNYLIDAACASSLLAVQAAMDELRTGRSDMMLAGGVNASIPAEVYMVFTQLGALSKAGKVRPFDSDGDGTLLGEGLGVIVLKRLEDAVADGDRVYATVKGVGQSSDGRGAGLLAPRLEGEILAMRRAMSDADLSPEGIGLIEAHGTGIPLGDRTEMSALREVFGDRLNGLPTCAVGSVKSMIGHCIPAAGIAGIIKTALALHYRTLPPTICGTVREGIGIEATPCYVNTRARPWIQPSQRPRRAAVNAFGFGGINTHAILEEAPPVAPIASPAAWPCELIVLAAASTGELAAKAELLRGVLGRRPNLGIAAIALELARDTNTGPSRLAIVAESAGDLMVKLDKAIDRLHAGRGRFQMRSGVFASDTLLDGKLAFVFPGEGAQYQGMLDDVLIAFPEARRWFDFWDGIYGDSRTYPPSACVFPPPTTLDAATSAELERALYALEVGSESVFIASQALLAVTRRLGLLPDVMVGHSSGEHSALRAAGVIGSDDWDDLKARILDLNRLYQRMEEAGAIGSGALLTVGAVARERLLALAETDGVHLALDNCHHQAVLYGAPERMEAVAAMLRSEGGLCAFLPFDRPYHTSLFEPVARMVESVYATMGFRAAGVPLYSCATAAPMPASAEGIRHLAADQWQSRVRFTETIQRMYADGVRIFIEVGPSSNLTGFIDDILKGSEALAVALDARRRPSLEQFLQTFGRLWLTGRAIDVEALFAGRDIAPANLGQDAPPRREQVFANILPYAALTEAEAAPLRDRLSLARAAARDVRPSEAAVPPGVAGEVPGTEAPAETGDLDHVLDKHFSLMRQFLELQDSVLRSSLTATATEPAPLHFLHRIISQDADLLVAECDIDIETDDFLRQHVLYTTEVSDLDPELRGLPVVALAVSLEMIAEVAAASQPGLVPLCLEHVRALDWVVIEDGKATLTMEARRLASVDGEVRCSARIARGDAVLVEAEVVLGAGPRATAFALPPLTSPRAPVWRDEDLYTTGMFHGPLFHSIAHLRAWDEGGLDAELAATPLDDFATEAGSTTLLLNPVLLDAIGHVTAFWIAQSLGTDFSSFPSSIERIDLFDARREDTAGFQIGGRVAFEGGGEQGPSFLRGDFACVATDSAPVFVARGWRDRFFRVPHTFYTARYRPREGWYGEEVRDLFGALPERATVWSVPAFPKGFLTDAGGIWRRVIANTVLAAEERAQFRNLPPRAARWADWLVGRIAIKEAARHWIERNYGVLLMPADLVVRLTPEGKPYIADDGLEALGAMPEISMAHARGEAVAIAADPGCPVGIDLELRGRADTEDLLRGAFSAGEQALVRSGSETSERTLRGWCAKEAAAKLIGVGLNGRPRQFVLSDMTIDSCDARVDTSELRGIRVSLASQGEMVLAVAFGASYTIDPPKPRNRREDLPDRRDAH